MSNAGRRSWWVYAIVVVALLLCLWIGWRDVDLNVPQAVVRDTIRSSIRRVVQILVQYVVPLALLGFLASEALTRLRDRDDTDR